MEDSEIDHRARLLCQGLVDGVAKSNLCTVTTAIYDTAWLSMISKKEGGVECWLFPESFQYLLSQQLPNGGWESYATEEDGMLNSLTALLALTRHRGITDADSSAVGLQDAIQSAISYLEASLQKVDLDGSLPVGFEIVIPALLAMLENESVHLSFPAKDSLLAINEVKMEAFHPDLLYGTTETTLLHSLEALIGKIDFNRIRHRKICGSMMASPASTAAYLMNVCPWDEEAEFYLRKAVREGPGQGNGAVPSVFPTPVFETSWVISTLFQGGFSNETLGQESLESIASYLEQHYHAQSGLLGFAPLIQADADDSAKTILSLNLLGRPVHAKSLTEHFRSNNSHFRTYLGERDASFSANCNVLRALLEAPGAQDHIADIKNIADFLCESWWSGAIQDKWNISSQYSMMLLAEALVRLLELWDQGQISQLPNALLRDRLPVTLLQILNRTLMGQSLSSSGEPDQPLEPMAYAVLTLKALSSLPWVGNLLEEVLLRMEQSQRFLRECGSSWNKPQYLWVEKVTYGSPFLSEAYYLAAIHRTKKTRIWTEEAKSLVQIAPKEKKEVTHLFCKLQCFLSEPLWKIQACVLEGLAFLPQLRISHRNVLDGEQSAKNEYLKFIPCTWVVVNNIQELSLDTYLLWDMMVLTLCNFRVDEYMETTIARLSETDLKEAKTVIQTLCNEWKPPKHALMNTATTKAADHSPIPYSSPPSAQYPGQAIPAPPSTRSPTLADVRAAISPYIDTTLGHLRIARASGQNHSALRVALFTFLNSHIDQTLTNTLFSSQKLSPTHSFIHWLHTIAAPSVSAHFSFTFLICLIGGLPTPTTRYLGIDLSARVAVMSRMYNDLGSIVRDKAEGNVNCGDFAELTDDDEQVPGDGRVVKARLEELARYERDAVGWVGTRLVRDLKSGGVVKDRARKANAVRLFLGVAELYADLYVVKDLSNNKLHGGI
ncbi:MAG: hypothetical protein Q9163_004515 [Psora crenata]